MEKQSTFWSYLSGLSTAVAGAWTLQEVALVCGIVTSVGTFIVNTVYKHLERRDAQAKRGQCDA